MARLERTYWWHVGRLDVVRRQLQQIAGGRKNLRILNVGAGTGGTVDMLAAFGAIDHVDMADEAIAYLHALHIPNVIQADAVKLPYADNTYDIVIALDVLEHIEDDLAALNEWRRVLRPGGEVVLTVPAYQWLWSEHDESLHHFRRYTASGLHALCNHAHFTVRTRTYIITLFFPIIVGYRAIRHFIKPKHSTSYVMLPAWLNWVFTKLVQLEGILVKTINLPFGTSVLMTAKK